MGKSQKLIVSLFRSRDPQVKLTHQFLGMHMSLMRYATAPRRLYESMKAVLLAGLYTREPHPPIRFILVLIASMFRMHASSCKADEQESSDFRNAQCALSGYSGTNERAAVHYP